MSIQPVSTARISSQLVRRMMVAMAGSSSRLGRSTTHPIGAALCLALGYMVLCSTYIILSGRIAAGAAWSIEQLRNIELLKGLAFVLTTGAGFFGFAAFLLKRIARQQQHLDLIFQGVTDSLFLIQVAAPDDYRFLCVNAAFLRVTGLQREAVVGQRLEVVLPATAQTLAKRKYQEVIRERKTVQWEECALYPTGRRVGEIMVTPLTDKTGAVVQLAGIIHDITARKRAEDEVRRLTGHLLRSQEEERRRIGRELHDSTAQELVAVALNLEMVQKRGLGRDVTSDELVADSQALIENCQRELRTLVYQLHPPVLDEMGLVSAVQEYTAGFTQRSGIAVTLDASPTLGRLPPETELALFRVVQESLGNIHRHSGSAAATIRLTREGTEVLLEISDQGRGLHVEDDGTVANAGVGLAGMRERVRQLGGRFEIESSDRGTLLRASIPGKDGPV